MATTSVARRSDHPAYRTFLARALRDPKRIGAVLPSSPSLAREMATVVPSETGSTGGPVVVELGPGTGALSGAVASRLPAGGRHVAVEVDSGMVRYLRSTRPALEVIQADAANLSSVLGDVGIEAVDAVISGLPWSIFSADVERAILREVAAVLAPGGAFTTFAYLHALGMAGARRFRRRIGGIFDEVVTSRTVWRNVPPARIYVCRRPVSRSPA